jgi:DNA-binding MarR family transcriptional regulator
MPVEGSANMPRKPLDQLNAGRSFYAQRMPEMESEHFGPLWHLFTVGHLVTTDLDGIAGKLGYSFADLDLLGTLAIDQDMPHRATDLASTLHISNAVISTRIARREKAGVLKRQRNPEDRRVFDLALTPPGRALIERAIVDIAAQSKLVRFFRQLSPTDRQTLSRLLGDLHQRFDREFIGGL